MDADYGVNVEEIKRTLDASEVSSLYFPFLGKTLLIDLRSNERAGPFIAVVPQVASGEERLRSLRRLRPGFPRPKRLSLIPWPKFVTSLAPLGVWDHVLKLCAEFGNPDLIRTCEKCLDELKEFEREALQGAISGGEGFETLWERDHPDA